MRIEVGNIVSLTTLYVPLTAPMLSKGLQHQHLRLLSVHFAGAVKPALVEQIRALHGQHLVQNLH